MPKAEYRLSPKAIHDLNIIWTYIAARNEPAADAVLQRIRAKIKSAVDQPEMGPRRPKLGPRARILVEGQYVVVYEIADYGVYVVAVAHSKRRLSNWLKDKK